MSNGKLIWVEQPCSGDSDIFTAATLVSVENKLARYKSASGKEGQAKESEIFERSAEEYLLHITTDSVDRSATTWWT